MAHSTLHFAAGLAIGSAAALPPLLCAWHRGQQLAPAFARWFAIGYATGTFAVVPAILRNLGVPDAICDGPWMNVFLLYPWMNAVKPGAVTMGPLVLATILGAQYALLIAALVWTRHALHKSQATPPA
ncbi:MAG: hypothetical protein O3B24_08535 [Verrucomicrobia bacterium]|nr:hypothetical protein [Verrucomicrobiota bacterium]